MDAKKLQGLCELKAHLQTVAARTRSAAAKHEVGNHRRAPFDADLAETERHIAFVQSLIAEESARPAA